jgi:threonine dehydratase
MTAIALEEIEKARDRIAGRVRRTPLLRTRHLLTPLHEGLLLKLECLQVTGSFKARGAMNALLSLDEEQIGRGIITASGGNHGIAVAFAGWSVGAPTVIYLPRSAPQEKADRLKAWGAELVIEGEGWDEANAAAMAQADAQGLAYIHPFKDPAVIAGQGTLGLEMLRQDKGLEVLLVAIGGGGLISGVASAVKAVKPDIRVIGIEPVGAPTLKESLAAGELVTLPQIETRAGTLAPRRSAEINLDIIGQNVDDIVLVSDEEMAAAARWLWFEMGIAAELSGAAALAAVQAGHVSFEPGTSVAALVCGAGRDGIA